MADSEKKPTAVSVADCWKRIEAWLSVNNAELHEALNPPANNTELAQLEKVLGTRLTDDFKESWRIHNGNGDTEGSLIPPLDAPDDVYGNSTTPGGCYLMPCTEIVQEWQNWKGFVDIGEFANQVSRPDKGIQNAWWHLGWIPFASNGGGDSICLDLAPTHEGTVGQVITMNHETSERELLAPSFAQWLARLADLIEDGEAQEE
jgi:cell wall assembly regulator SMI1